MEHFGSFMNSRVRCSVLNIMTCVIYFFLIKHFGLKEGLIRVLPFLILSIKISGVQFGAELEKYQEKMPIIVFMCRLFAPIHQDKSGRPEFISEIALWGIIYYFSSSDVSLMLLASSTADNELNGRYFTLILHIFILFNIIDASLMRLNDIYKTTYGDITIEVRDNWIIKYFLLVPYLNFLLIIALMFVPSNHENEEIEE